MEMEPLTLVIIEDEEAHFQLMKRAVGKDIPSASIHHFSDPATCLEKLEEVGPDVIVADYMMPGMNGIEFLEALRGLGKDIPVIVVTGQGDEKVAVQAMKLGAWDYLVKSADCFTLLPSVIAKVVRERRLRDSLQESAQLNDVLLNSLPHPAMLVRRDRIVLAANRIARELGARIGGYCWHDFGHGEFISQQHKDYMREHCGDSPPGGSRCAFCLLDEALETNEPANAPEVHAFERLWDTWWIPIDEESALHYAVDITARKQAEERIRSLSQQLIRAQEEERRKLSYDLHDTIGQELSCLKIGIDTLSDRQDSPREKEAKISQLSKMLHGSIKLVCNLAYHLRPGSLDQLGLVRAVQEYCQDFTAAHGVHVDFLAAGMDNLELDFDTGITLYRLIQEGLTNVRKHAGAGHVTIRLVASSPKIILHMEDNGIGFDMRERLASPGDKRCLGLQSMEERVALLDGKMRLESRPMKGTKIRIEVPIKEKKHDIPQDHPDH